MKQQTITPHPLEFLLVFPQTLLFFTAQVVMVIVGIFIAVPIMLLLGKYDESTSTPYTQLMTHLKWKREVFPALFWLWDNVEDSSLGDIRGKWAATCFGANPYSSFNRYWWMAWRNPANNFKRYIIGVDVRDYWITRLAGQEYVRDDMNSTGWQILRAVPLLGGIPRYSIYVVLAYPWNKERAFVFQFGAKIKISHNTDVEKKDIDYFKGFTTELNFYKNIK